SRRRHTRSDRDWSSDVCSSDLCFGARLADYKSEIKGMKLLSRDRFAHAQQMAEIEAEERQQFCRALLQAGLEKRPPTREQLTARSEERRVGKEGRARWSPDQ